MTIDVKLLRQEQGGDPESVRRSEAARGRDPSVVDRAIEADGRWRKAIFEVENAKKEVNSVNKQIASRKKADRSDKCEDLMAKSTQLKKTIPDLEAGLETVEKERDGLLGSIGNIVAPDVPVSNDEVNNKVLRTWGEVDSAMKIDGTPGRMHHHEVLAKLCGYNPKKGSEVAGHRGYYLLGDGALLNFALAMYGQQFLRRREYLPVYPPFFMKKEVMSETAELADFAETLYRIPMGRPAKMQDANSVLLDTMKRTDNEDADRDDLFMIATSEQPISALHRGEFMHPNSLPKRYAGYSTCFRKEAGSHGKDMWGIFRIHQFEKVEQFIVCKPEESWRMQEEMISVAEEFYKSLRLPYRVVAIVSGVLNDAAARKYDLEAWFPGYEDYRELVSCSNCTDFQSRALSIRLGHPSHTDREKTFVHLLNGTLCATQRTLCCILENYQTPEGVVVPEVLRPFLDGRDFLPFPNVVDARENS